MTYEFRNDKYKQLQVHCPSGKARFVDGRFETDDKALADELAALDFDFYGVQPVNAPDEGDQDPPGDGEGSGDGPEDIKPPARSASKADWVAYADSQDPGDHESMTKDELIAQYGSSE